MSSKRLSLALSVAVACFGLTTLMTAQSSFKTLQSFGTGTEIIAGVVFDKAGNLYGATGFGGTTGAGSIFELSPNPDGSWTQKVLHSFTGAADGGVPLPSLIVDRAGNLYGTARQGGAIGNGVVFQMVPNTDGSWTENILHSFGGPDGSDPFGGVTFDQAGSLYGTTREGGAGVCTGGCGVVYKLAPNADGSWTESVLHSFCAAKGCSDGINPYIESLVFDQAGNLYGTTESGGRRSANGGTVFKLTPNSDGIWSEKVLHSFCSLAACADGSYPLAGLVADHSGNLYGTTESGGTAGDGTVFELSPNADGSWTEKVLHSFHLNEDGAVPDGSLIFDQAGNLYGTAWGGPGGYGVAFKLSPTSNGNWRETVLHAFRDHSGALPNSGLTFDAAGNLYGTTEGDGNTTFGSVFEITP
jgi:uncharacterized repeat protein (TIGR03803 family)